MLVRAITLAVATGVLLSSNAYAQPKTKSKANMEEARERYMAAEAAGKKGDWKTAAAEYRAAYDANNDPVLFFKIGSAFDRLGDCDSAKIYYQRYLEEGKPNPEYKARTLELIEGCKAAPPKDDGSGDDGAGTGADLGDDAPAGPTSGSPDLDEGGSSWHRSAAWTSVGLTFALATSGAVLALSASSREDDIASLIAFRDAGNQPEAYTGAVKDRYDDLVSEGEKLATASYITLGLAGAFAASAAIFFIIDPTGSSSDSSEVSLSPALGPNEVGVTAGWSF